MSENKQYEKEYKVQIEIENYIRKYIENNADQDDNRHFLVLFYTFRRKNKVRILYPIN